MAGFLGSAPAGSVEVAKAELARLRRVGYRVVGRHSAVKICHWTRSVLRGGKNCYKGWYGIRSHRCLQMTPSLQYCNMMCIFCWRHHTINRVTGVGGEWDRPEDILDGLIREQRQLLSGFKGNPIVDRKLFDEAMEPRHVAISLDGEPTIYPYLADMVKLVKSRGMTAFLVTNGTNPDRLMELVEENAEPTNLYISLYGPDPETHRMLCRPLIPDSWERLMRSLRVMREFQKSVKVVRLIMINDYTIQDPEKYAELIRIGEPDFIECKGYMHVGESQKRDEEGGDASLHEIRPFAMKLADALGYEYLAEDRPSRVSLIANPSSPHYDVVRMRVSGPGTGF
ncbi:MAG: 4-demethylwyosine synthase TYW1 [Aigarchaeota archaeon]|nr:4-demethylwyosine synthase TYW1 [Candidatus Wolframiiraptor gerlachensis]